MGSCRIIPASWFLPGFAAALLLAAGFAHGQYRNYSLRCLAPLLRNLDPASPKNLQEAFLAGPKRFAVPLEGIGDGAIEFPVSTDSEEARQFFTQGVALLHGLRYREAERTFRTVVELDPDCPMGYWGLAQATERRPATARVYARAAKDRCDANRPEIERRWIDILADFAAEGLEEDLPARSSARIRALEDLSLDFPDHREVRAFLLRRLTLDPYLAGVPPSSALGIDTMARQFAAEFPAHPSRHYRTFLWLERRPGHVLEEIPEMTATAPGSPGSWRFAAEAYRSAGRSPEAIALAEAAVRVEHADLARRELLPWESESLRDNYGALADLLVDAGRIDDAIRWIARALSLPREDAGETGEAVQDWANALMVSGQWERLLEDLEPGSALAASQLPGDRAARLLWKGLALLALGRVPEAEAAAGELATLQRETLVAGATPSEEATIAEKRKTLETILRFLVPYPDTSPPPTLDADGLPPIVKALFLEKSGRGGEAFRLLDEEIRARPYRWLPTAHFCRLARDTGQLREAAFRIDRRFRTDAGRADADLSLVRDLAPLAEELRLPRTWTLPAPEPRIPALPADLDDLGPESRAFPTAPDFELADRLGRSWQLSRSADGPVLLNFFLGVRCAFCLEQFETFQPHFADFSEAGIAIVAVSSDSVEQLREVLGETEEIAEGFRERFPFPVLADPELSVFRDYGVFDDFENGPMHATVLVGAGGEILWRNIGHEPFSDPAWLLGEARRLIELHAAAAMEDR